MLKNVAHDKRSKLFFISGFSFPSAILTRKTFDKNIFSRYSQKLLAFISTSELEIQIEKAKKKSGKKGIFSFYFNFDGEKVIEKRDIPTEPSNSLFCPLSPMTHSFLIDRSIGLSASLYTEH
jgi:hypothetical protein